MVGAFVSDLYEGTLHRLPDALVERLQRDAAIDGAGSYDPGYRPALESESEYRSELEWIYRSFVGEAQGDGSTNEIFAPSSQSEPSLASAWAQTHGLHVSLSDPDASVLRLPEVVLVWFNLANSAQNEMQSFAHAVRGVLSLALGIEYLTEPPADASAGAAFGRPHSEGGRRDCRIGKRHHVFAEPGHGRRRRASRRFFGSDQILRVCRHFLIW